MAAGFTTANLAIETVEVALTAGATVANRELLIVRNKGQGSVYIGTTGVTPTTGMELMPGEIFRIEDNGANDYVRVLAYFGIAGAMGANVEVTEGATA